MKNNKKKGVTLIELIVFIALSTIIVAISSEVLIHTRKVYSSILNRNETLNELEDLSINIDNIIKIDGRTEINSKGNIITVTYVDELSGVKNTKEILLNNNRIVVNHYNYIDDTKYNITTNVLLDDIENFKVKKRNKLIFILVTKGGEEYIECL